MDKFLIWTKLKKFKIKKINPRLSVLQHTKNFAKEADKYADIVLVGDSLGSVLYNFNTTRKVTIKNMIDHSKSGDWVLKKV